jgi:hypothetical protein
VWRAGAGFESALGSHMVLNTVYRSVCARFFAALIVVLVLLPFTEPFPTIDGTDFSGAGAVDACGESKLKKSAQDALPAPAMSVVAIYMFTSAETLIMLSPALDSRPGERRILRV